MPEKTPFDHFLSLDARKRYGRPNGYGNINYGLLRYGEYNPKSGIYQKRVKRLDFWTKTYQPKGYTYTCKMRFYKPTNPRTIPQQNWRSKFAFAVANWQALTPKQKKMYNKRAIGKNLSGYNLFISEQLKSYY
jgi:hypothetical protein